MMNEIWKDIPDYENTYMISNFGNVVNVKTERVLKTCTNKLGYKRVGLSKSGQGQKFLIQRLVAQAFPSDWNPNWIVRHKNYDKNNNTPHNLEMISRSDNRYHLAGQRFGFIFE